MGNFYDLASGPTGLLILPLSSVERTKERETRSEATISWSSKNRFKVSPFKDAFSRAIADCVFEQPNPWLEW